MGSMNNPTRNPKGPECKCCTCGKIFKSIKGFDNHWTGKNETRRCATDDELAVKKFRQDAKLGTWAIEADPAKIAKLRAIKR